MATLTTRSLMDRDIQAIRDDVLRLGSLVEEQTERAVRALKDRNLSLAHQVASVDERVNALRYRIEEECLTTIARHQPAAGDLRLIIASMHMAVEMERMADHAAGIAGVVVRMGDEPLLKPLIDIPRMQIAACAMLRAALDAYIRGDVGLANEVVQWDEEVDALYNQVLPAVGGPQPGAHRRPGHQPVRAHRVHRHRPAGRRPARGRGQLSRPGANAQEP
jgi:phosphate transport system protein